jgi:3-phosphoglycerate kinase
MNLKGIKNSIVLVRVCYDVPSLTDIDRIINSVPTVKALLSQGNQVILLSHWGRPEGKRVPELSLEKLLPVVQSQFTENVEFINQYDYFDKHMSLRDLMNITKTKLFLFENTRFHPHETSQNLFARDELAQKYSEIADYFVDEAFAVSHRQEVTNYEVKKLMSYSYGLSFENELTHLEKIKTNPERRFVVLMAGAKLETKLPLIEKMCEKADLVLIGGELCFTFLKALGPDLDIELYDSVVEEHYVQTALELMKKYPEKIILPVDFVYGERDGVKLALDLGEDTLALYKYELSQAKTIFWNGPVGYYLDPQYAKGTLEIGEYIASLSNIYRVLGGGDSVAVMPKKVLSSFDFVSMGGGATLEYLAD